MQRRIPQLFVLLFTAIAFFSCGKIQRSSQPSATGRAGEMLVVMEARMWEGKAGELVKNVFQQPEPMFLQPEPLFDLVQISPDGFVKLFETHRHILIADVDAAHPKAELEISRDVWSFPQMVVRIKAPNDSVFEAVLTRNQEALIEHYLQIERERLINAYQRMTNAGVRNAVSNKFGISMTVPEGYFIGSEGEDFIWLRRTGTRDDFDLGLLVSRRPYKDPAVDFDPAVIRARRDSITKKYIPGQFEGSFMTTYPELEPTAREISFNGKYAIESRSLWRVEGDFMGGPYASYTMVDENTNHLFTFDGFVYAPNFNKRDYLRQLIAIIYSIEFNGAQE